MEFNYVGKFLRLPRPGTHDIWILPNAIHAIELCGIMEFQDVEGKSVTSPTCYICVGEFRYYIAVDGIDLVNHLAVTKPIAFPQGALGS